MENNQLLHDCLSVGENGRLSIGGADVSALADKYGTPVYLMDEDQIRSNCRTFRAAMQEYYGENTAVAYASKAFACLYMYKILKEEGMYADVVSSGELYTALAAGFPASRCILHGNNKTVAEMEYALESGVGCIAVDNFEELETLSGLAEKKGLIQDISYRVKPGVDAHTHEFILTGGIDSKFGVSLEDGGAFEMAKRAIACKSLRLAGVHCHIGSQIFEAEPFRVAATRLAELIFRVKTELGYEIASINLGGGFGIKYLPSDNPPSPGEIMGEAAQALKDTCVRLDMKMPRVIIEPGRSIVGDAGITVYTVGSVKEIPGVRTYVSVDGGMTDNPRKSLYDAEYYAVLPERPLAQRDRVYTISGRNCESDRLIENTSLPQVSAGDKLCVLSTGAYNYAMAMNYNKVPRAPVIMISSGKDKLVVRRETFEDLLACDVRETL